MSRWLRYLLIVLLALPAAQASARPGEHVQAPMRLVHHDHGTGAGHPSGSKAVHHHDCIGCIAPIDVDFYRPASVQRLAVTRMALPGNMTDPLARTLTPDPPPPRPFV